MGYSARRLVQHAGCIRTALDTTAEIAVATPRQRNPQSPTLQILERYNSHLVLSDAIRNSTHTHYTHNP